MCISRATVSAVSCLVVPAFICIDLLISLVLKINDDDDDEVGIPIADPFSQSRDSGLGNFYPGIPAGLWNPGSMISKTVINE